jgi:type II secretory pathway pseudopilin PulG
MKKLRKNKGITLIALVITIIVLLILAGVTIATLTGENGILNQANKAKTETTKASAKEQVEVEVLGSYGADGNLDNGLLKTNLSNIKEIQGVPDTIEDTSFPLTVTVDGVKIKIDKNGTVSYAFDAEEWDKTASDEDCFYWKSDDPNEEGYGTIIGYTEKIENYTVLRFPSRCTEIEFYGTNGSSEWSVYEDGTTVANSRAFTNNILKVEIPKTVIKIGRCSFGFDTGASFIKLREITIPESVISIGDCAFSNCTNLISVNVDTDNKEYSSNDGILFNKDSTKLIYWPSGKQAQEYKIPDSVTSIEKNAFRGATNLSSITIQNGVINIGIWAFCYWTSSQTINIQGYSSAPSGWDSNWNSGCSATINWNQ